MNVTPDIHITLDKFTKQFYEEYRNANPNDTVSNEDLNQEMLVRAEEYIEDISYLMRYSSEMLKDFPEDIKEEIKSKFKEQATEMGKSRKKIRARDIFYQIIGEYESSQV